MTDDEEVPGERQRPDGALLQVSDVHLSLYAPLLGGEKTAAQRRHLAYAVEAAARDFGDAVERALHVFAGVAEEEEE